MGSNSAEVAKDRLRRLSFNQWKDRVDEFLSLAGYRVRQFQDTPFESYYNAGLSAGRVAEVIIGCQQAAVGNRK